MPSAPVAVPTAALARDAAGTLHSPEAGDVYHCAQGGLAQARAVFLGGNALPARWQDRERFAILETGFGAGLNFLATWQAWRADPAHARRLHYVSTEHRPFAGPDLAAALAPFGELAPLARALCAAWPPPIEGFHRLHFDAGRVSLTLLLGDARAHLPALRGCFDAFYLDGFAPARDPGMWSPEVMRELARLAAPHATLATWTVAGGVRKALADAGFALEKRAGFGAKREMLAGHFARAAASTAPAGAARRAVVAGGGLAGTLVADRLAARGWEVEVIEARGPRDLPTAGLVRPIANLRDATNARLSRCAFLYALRHFRALQDEGYPLAWNPCGVLQLADGEEEARRFAAIVQGQGYPPQLLQSVDAARARELAGRTVRGCGWWFPSGAVVSPASLAVASAARAGTRVRRRMSCRVESVRPNDGGWEALDAAGAPIAAAPVLVVANAADAARLLPEARLRLASVRGQVTYLPPAPDRRLDIAVSGSGYVAPVADGGHIVGATYGHDDADEGVRAEEHRENLARAESMLPGFAAGVREGEAQGWTGFRTTVPDRLPVLGETEARGLYVATGLGSRGLLWGPLGAELLASAIAGEPSPLPAPLAAAVSPRRFLS